MSAFLRFERGVQSAQLLTAGERRCLETIVEFDFQFLGFGKEDDAGASLCGRFMGGMEGVEAVLDSSATSRCQLFRRSRVNLHVSSALGPERVDAGIGLLPFGESGHGKGRLAIRIASKVIQDGCGSRFVAAAKLLHEMHAWIRKSRATASLAGFIRPVVPAIDDLGDRVTGRWIGPCEGDCWPVARAWGGRTPERQGRSATGMGPPSPAIGTR